MEEFPFLCFLFKYLDRWKGERERGRMKKEKERGRSPSDDTRQADGLRSILRGI